MPVAAESDEVDASQLNIFAQRQLADFDAHQPGMMFADGFALSIEDAYALQLSVVNLRRNRGEATFGYKVGCTSPKIREQLKIDHPVFGSLFLSERHESGVQLSESNYDHLAIEGEMAITLGDRVPLEEESDDDWIAAIDRVFPVIELHNYVFRSTRPNVAELISNNALQAGIVAPSVLRQQVSNTDKSGFANCSMTIEIDGSIVDHCGPTNMMSCMFKSVRWLAEVLPQHEQSLKPGDTVLTGSLMALIPVKAGNHVVVDAGEWGRVEIEVTN